MNPPKIDLAFSTDTMLASRNTTHGDFELNAYVSQTIKSPFRATGAGLTSVQREALDLIATNLSRIASGKADFRDHWDDIIGYASLALRDIEARTAPDVERRSPPGVPQDLPGLRGQA